mmetsp:Transcript_107302/g.308721  ORF Transcript_107302/g.308721 Transcript_107302/m.308721 type:complete len:239 (-) Transcript_107302:488-1204(-)
MAGNFAGACSRRPMSAAVGSATLASIESRSEKRPWRAGPGDFGELHSSSSSTSYWSSSKPMPFFAGCATSQFPDSLTGAVDNDRLSSTTSAPLVAPADQAGNRLAAEFVDTVAVATAPEAVEADGPTAPDCWSCVEPTGFQSESASSSLSSATTSGGRTRRGELGVLEPNLACIVPSVREIGVTSGWSSSPGFGAPRVDLFSDIELMYCGGSDTGLMCCGTSSALGPLGQASMPPSVP